MYEISAVDFNGTSHKVDIDVFRPDYCPSCHRHQTPNEIDSFLSGDGPTSQLLQRVYRCTNRDCGRLFLAYYKGVKQTGFGTTRSYFYRSVLPGRPLPPDIPDNVANVSPTFADVYKQAAAAEHYGLSEVCGVGYRKCLEFLVKDFLIFKAGELGVDAESIKKANLGQCIENYIDDPKTKAVAKRATWLGNDETHYVRKWEGKDLTDLKNLLHLTINSIDNDLLAAEYLADMDEG